jgi:transposase-like protein
VGKKSCQDKILRFPEPVSGIQTNFCKSVTCANFMLAPHALTSSKDWRIDMPTEQEDDPCYTKVATAKGVPALKCRICGDITALKSNLGVFEERSRLGAYLLNKSDLLSCPNKSCENHAIPLAQGAGHYYLKGQTSGNQRYQCKTCKKTFSSGSKRRQQLRPEINKQLFALLMNKSPIKRCCELLEISPPTFYHKLDWLYEQALGFIKDREVRLLKSFAQDRLYLSTDRQSHASNWLSRKDKRNTELLAIGTADNRSGYVFGWHFNFDPRMNAGDVEAELLRLGDLDVPSAYRKNARLWLPSEFQARVAKSCKSSTIGGVLSTDIAVQYEIEQLRHDMEAIEDIDETVKTPSKGMLIHSEYTMYGHFYLLRDLLPNVDKVRFYLDQEAGIRSAFLNAFGDRVRGHTADAFFVKTSKNLTVDEKDKLIAASRRRIEVITGVGFGSLSHEARDQAIVDLIIQEMGNMHSYQHGREQWLNYPFATKSEPEKQVAPITDISKLNETHQANLYKNATLHGIDRFFMQARRRVNIFERPFITGANARRTWYGYSTYDPAVLTKMATLFRLFYNYINNDTKDKQTPAMRLGLAKGPVAYEKIIYFDRY